MILFSLTPKSGLFAVESSLQGPKHLLRFLPRWLYFSGEILDSERLKVSENTRPRVIFRATTNIVCPLGRIHSALLCGQLRLRPAIPATTFIGPGIIRFRTQLSAR